MFQTDPCLQSLTIPFLVVKPSETDFITVDASESFLKLLKVGKEEVLEKNPLELFFRSKVSRCPNQEGFVQALKKVVDTGKSGKLKRWRFDVPGRRNSGKKEKYWNLKQLPIFNEEGQLDHIIISFTDITKKVRARQKKEQLLRELQLVRERNQHFIEGNPDGMFSLDRNGRFLSANEGAARLAQISLQELLQVNFHVFCHPEHRDYVNYHFQRTLSGIPTVFEALFVVGNDCEIMLEISLMPIRGQHEIEGVYCITKNKTALWEAEKVVIKKNNFLKANASFISGLFEKGLDDAALEKAFASVGKAVGVDRMYYFGVHCGPEGCGPQISILLEWADRWVSRKKDCPKMKNLDLQFVEAVMPLAPDQPFAMITAEIEHEEMRQLFEEKQIKSLLILPVFVREKLYGFVGFDDCKTERIWTEEEILFLQNLTRNLMTAFEKRAAEEQLKEKEIALIKSEKKFRALVQEGSDMFTIMDANGNYMFASASVLTVLGTRPEDLVGKNALEFVHPEDLENVQKALIEIHSVKQKRLSLRYRNSLGEWRWLDVKATNMLEDPAVEGIVTNSRDITESREAWNKIQKQNQVLREIAWNQSHVVRAPVAKIQGLLEIIAMDDMLHPHAADCLQYLQESARELDEIIRDIVLKTEEMGQE